MLRFRSRVGCVVAGKNHVLFIYFLFNSIFDDDRVNICDCRKICLNKSLVHIASANIYFIPILLPVVRSVPEAVRKLHYNGAKRDLFSTKMMEWCDKRKSFSLLLAHILSLRKQKEKTRNKEKSLSCWNTFRFMLERHGKRATATEVEGEVKKYAKSQLSRA